MFSGAPLAAKRAACQGRGHRGKVRSPRIPAPTAANSNPPINSLTHALMMHPPGRVKEQKWRVKPKDTLLPCAGRVNELMEKMCGQTAPGIDRPSSDTWILARLGVPQS